MNFPKVSFQLMYYIPEGIIKYQLIKTKQRLTFDIRWQHPDTIFRGKNSDDYYKFVASNGYEIISRSCMDIQTERLWLFGAKENERSGTMVFSSDEKRDRAYVHFEQAINEWVVYVTNHLTEE